jgi:hypothetical protein
MLSLFLPCRAADAKLAQLEASRDLSRTWLHADMDAFYARYCYGLKITCVCTTACV